MSMTTSVVLIDDVTQTRAAIAGFLAGYCGATACLDAGVPLRDVQIAARHAASVPHAKFGEVY